MRYPATLSLIAIGLSVRTAQLCETGWAVIDLGEVTLSSPGAAMRISNTGYAVGEQFLWHNGVLVHTFTGEANAVNDAGHVAEIGPVEGVPGQYPLLWDGSTAHLLAPTATSAYGLNNHDAVVGQAGFGGAPHAFIWQDGRITDLGTLLGIYSSDAFDVSDTGFVVGSSFNVAGQRRAYRWFNGQMLDLGTLPGGMYSIAFGVNDSGTVVGFSVGSRSPDRAPGGYGAFLWSQGQMVELPRLNGNAINVAFAINDRGQIVGYSTAGGPFPYHAVVWEDGTVIDLQQRVLLSLGIDLETAFDINDHGWIVGAAKVGGVPHAYLMRPSELADLNCDGFVNSVDLGILLGNWSLPPSAPACGGALPCAADLNGDGAVNSLDLGILLVSWTL